MQDYRPGDCGISHSVCVNIDWYVWRAIFDMKLDAPFTFSSLSERGIFLIRLLFSLNLLSKTFSSSWKLDHSRCQFEASFDSSYTIKNVLSLLLNNISNSKFENVTDPAHNLCSISRNNEIVIFCQNLMIFMWSVLDIKKTFQQLNWLLHETFSFDNCHVIWPTNVYGP